MPCYDHVPVLSNVVVLSPGPCWGSPGVSVALSHYLFTFTAMYIRVAMKIFEGLGEALCKEFSRGWKPVSIIHYTRPRTCINHPLH